MQSINEPVRSSPGDSDSISPSKSQILIHIYFYYNESILVSLLKYFVGI